MAFFFKNPTPKSIKALLFWGFFLKIGKFVKIGKYFIKYLFNKKIVLKS